MDVLLYTSSLGNGGAEKHLQRIANAMDEEGHRVVVAEARKGGHYEQNLADGVELIVLSNGWLNSSTWRLMRSVRPLRQYVSRHRPDVVCSVMDHVNVRLMRALNGVAHPPPAVLSVQNNPQMRFGDDSSWRGRLLFWRMKRTYRHADRIVALSEGVAHQLVELEVADPARLSVIHNAGLDDEVLDSKEAPLRHEAPKGPLLVACGSLTPQKGYSYLLKSFRQVLDQREAGLWILGEGEQRPAIESQANSLGIDEHVSLLGFRANPFKFMAAADAFVLSSLWEGFGNVIVEAMACGTPVVSTDCPYGPGEIISHEENGLLVPPANVEALSLALLRLLDDPNLRKQLAENGRERAQDFHARTIGRQYLDLFQDVVSEQKKAAPTDGESS